MNKSPSLAAGILTRLGPPDESLVGDLLQEFAAGRSRVWFWRQVLSAVWYGMVRDVAGHPARAAKAVTMGWVVLFLVFGLLGDVAAEGLARLLWNWDRQLAYAGEQAWWPFWICAGIASYSGFAVSGWAVARVNQRNPAVLLAYVTTILAGLIASAIIIEVLTQRWGRVPLPHTFFYFASVGLPYFWRVGLVLAPFATLLGGLAAGRSRTQPG